MLEELTGSQLLQGEGEPWCFKNLRFETFGNTGNYVYFTFSDYVSLSWNDKQLLEEL